MDNMLKVNPTKKIGSLMEISPVLMKLMTEYPWSEEAIRLLAHTWKEWCQRVEEVPVYPTGPDGQG